MSHGMFNAAQIREAILSSLPGHTSRFGPAQPNDAFLYIPESHSRALSFDTSIVHGPPGAGKSLWWAALQSPAHRDRIARVLGPRGLDARTEVRPGFGASSGDYPGKLTLQEILSTHDSEHIWRAVVLRTVSTLSDRGDLGPLGNDQATWRQRVDWVVAHGEQVERALADCDARLERDGKRFLVVFDALDRTASDWKSRNKLLRGLLVVLLDLRSSRNIRGKAFVRPGMLDHPDITNFPDASKLVTNDVRLDWARADLYGLLWQHLANAPKSSEAFRLGCTEHFKLDLIDDDGIFRMPPRIDARIERDLVHAVTGPYMGAHYMRGDPYTWIPNHLADTAGGVSPRSFLAAIRRAAELAEPSQTFPIAYKGIQAGVQYAASIRVQEVAKDSPWVKTAVWALEGLTIPCEFAQVRRRWKGLLAQLREQEDRPQRMDEGLDGIRRDLEELGIFERTLGGRVNMPDVYRVGFGLNGHGTYTGLA